MEEREEERAGLKTGDREKKGRESGERRRRRKQPLGAGEGCFGFFSGERRGEKKKFPEENKTKEPY